MHAKQTGASNPYNAWPVRQPLAERHRRVANGCRNSLLGIESAPEITANRSLSAWPLGEKRAWSHKHADCIEKE